MLLYISLICFAISFGSLRLQYSENPDAPINNSDNFTLISIAGVVISLGMIYLVLLKLFHLSWYKNIAILLLLAFVFSSFLAKLYGNTFGIKTQPQLSLKEGGYVRYHIRAYDALITFIVGLLSYILWTIF